MTTDPDTQLLPVSALLPGDAIDFDGDEYVDLPDRCAICDEAVTYRGPDRASFEIVTHDNGDLSHEPEAIWRNVTWEFEYAVVYAAYTPESFVSTYNEGIHDFPDVWQPMPGTVLIHTVQDDVFVLPADHMVKVDERRGAEAVAV